MPTYIESLPAPPDEWTAVVIGDITIKLPMSKYNKISGKETYLSLYSKSGSLALYDIAPHSELLPMIKEGKINYPYISYEQRLAIVKTLPSDISIFNSRKRNSETASNLILKAISIPVGGLAEVRILNSKALKAICLISEEGEGRLSTSADLYSSDEKRSLSMLLMNYKNKEEMTSDLLNLLSGIALPNQPPDTAKVSKDINTIVNTYKKTEQMATFR